MLGKKGPARHREIQFFPTLQVGVVRIQSKIHFFLPRPPQTPSPRSPTPPSPPPPPPPLLHPRHLEPQVASEGHPKCTPAFFRIVTSRPNPLHPSSTPDSWSPRWASGPPQMHPRLFLGLLRQDQTPSTPPPPPTAGAPGLLSGRPKCK